MRSPVVGPRDQFDAEMERRWDRLSRALFVGGLPFLVAAIVRHNLTAVMLLQAYLLTGLLFGYTLFVEEYDNLGERWLWKSIAAIGMLHVGALALVFLWDERNPDLAAKGLVSTAVLWALGVIEYCLTVWIVALCKPADKGKAAGFRRVGDP